VEGLRSGRASSGGFGRVFFFSLSPQCSVPLLVFSRYAPPILSLICAHWPPPPGRLVECVGARSFPVLVTFPPFLLSPKYRIRSRSPLHHRCCLCGSRDKARVARTPLRLLFHLFSFFPPPRSTRLPFKPPTRVPAHCTLSAGTWYFFSTGFWPPAP